MSKPDHQITVMLANKRYPVTLCTGWDSLNNYADGRIYVDRGELWLSGSNL